MSSLANWLRRDFENTFPRGFQTFDMLENDYRPRVDENTYYRMKQIVDNNGQVKVKTAVKEPGKEWNICVEEYNRDNANAIEQDKSQKKVEALEQGKTDNARTNAETNKTVNPKETEAPTKAEVKEQTVNTAESNAKDTKANATDASSKAENPDSLKRNSKEENRELSNRNESHYDELQTIVDSMERNFENALRRTLGMFEDNYSNRRMRRRDYDRNRHFSRRYYSPFDEIEEIFDTVKRDFDAGFRRDFDSFFNGNRRRIEDRNNRELARRNDSPFDEIEAIFDGMQRDFESRLRRTFGRFDESQRNSIEQDQPNMKAANGQEKNADAQKAEETSKASN